MRVVIESEHTLVVEAPGNYAALILVAVLVPLIAIHLSVLVPLCRGLFEVSRYGVAYVSVAVSVLVYILLGYLILKPLRDRITVTFHGLKNLVTVEHMFPFGIKTTRNISFQDFEQLEISAPQDKGFCGLRRRDGKVEKLFSIGKDDDFGAVKRLEMITRKKVETVR